MASPRERAISPPIEVTDMRGFGSRIWARPFIRAQRVVEEADEERAAALEAWFRDLGVSSASGAAHPIDGVLATGGVRAAGLVLRAARCLVGEENGKVFGDAHGDAWRDARGIARRFSACAFARWPGGDVPTPFDAIEAGEILLYCAACCDDRPERRGRVVRRILSLALPFQRELMDALRRQRRAEEGRDVAAGAAAMTVVPDPIARLAAGDDGGDLVRPPARDDPRGAGVGDPEDAALKTRFLDAVRSGRPLRVRGAARPGLDVRNLVALGEHLGDDGGAIAVHLPREKPEPSGLYVVDGEAKLQKQRESSLLEFLRCASSTEDPRPCYGCQIPLAGPDAAAGPLRAALAVAARAAVPAWASYATAAADRAIAGGGDDGSARLNAWIACGDAPMATVAHFDGFENFMVVLEGRKMVELWPPGEPGLCAQTAPFMSHARRGTDLPEPVERLLLEAGDVGFWPTGWWHRVVSAPRTRAVNVWWHGRHHRALTQGVPPELMAYAIRSLASDAAEEKLLDAADARRRADALLECHPVDEKLPAALLGGDDVAASACLRSRTLKRDALAQVVADHPASWAAFFPGRLTSDLTAHVLTNYFGLDHLDFLFDAHGADRARAKKHLLDRAERCATAAWRDVVLDASGLRSDPSVHVLEDDEDPRGGAAARQPASPTAARLAALCLVHDQREDPRLDGPQ